MREKRIAEIIAVLTIVGFICLSLLPHHQVLGQDENVFEYNEGWEYSCEGKTSQVTLPVSDAVSQNAAVTLTNTIPEEKFMDTGIVFRTRMQSAEVYVDGELIYTYPSEELIGDVLPGNWNFVHLPEDSSGKEIQIIVQSPYASFSGLMSEVLYGNYNELISYVFSNQLPVFRLSLLIGIAGAAVFVISSLFRKYNPQPYQKMLGLLFIFISLWLCLESRMPLVFISLEARYYIPLISLTLCPVFILAYLYTRWSKVYGRMTRTLYYISIAYAVICLALDISGLYDLIEIITYIHLFLAFVLCYTVFIYCVVFFRRKDHSIRSELVCIIIIFIAAVIELLRFYSGYTQIGGDYKNSYFYLYNKPDPFMCCSYIQIFQNYPQAEERTSL